MVSAYACELGVSLGQEGTAGKGHELAAIKALLDTLVLKGRIVTLDVLSVRFQTAGIFPEGFSLASATATDQLLDELGNGDEPFARRCLQFSRRCPRTP
jgi:hypothetical protein